MRRAPTFSSRPESLAIQEGTTTTDVHGSVHDALNISTSFPAVNRTFASTSCASVAEYADEPFRLPSRGEQFNHAKSRDTASCSSSKQSGRRAIPLTGKSACTMVNACRPTACFFIRAVVVLADEAESTRIFSARLPESFELG